MEPILEHALYLVQHLTNDVRPHRVVGGEGLRSLRKPLPWVWYGMDVSMDSLYSHSLSSFFSIFIFLFADDVELDMTLGPGQA